MSAATGPNSQVVLQKEGSSLSQFQCPILKPTNYTVWAIRIKTILEANGLWETIEPAENTQTDVKKDKATIGYLFQTIPEDVVLQVASCKRKFGKISRQDTLVLIGYRRLVGIHLYQNSS
ncbi:hypothetical protein HanIR_Chr12g0614881 [Helianthus annuus]|nr:hypothetical protein HanIR_Chr12g0614881 [Helianthus annuus]